MKKIVIISPTAYPIFNGGADLTAYTMEQKVFSNRKDLEVHCFYYLNEPKIPVESAKYFMFEDRHYHACPKNHLLLNLVKWVFLNKPVLIISRLDAVIFALKIHLISNCPYVVTLHSYEALCPKPTITKNFRTCNMDCENCLSPADYTWCFELRDATQMAYGVIPNSRYTLAQYKRFLPNLNYTDVQYSSFSGKIENHYNKDGPVGFCASKYNVHWKAPQMGMVTKRLSHVKFRLLGDIDKQSSNVKILGRLPYDKITEFYSGLSLFLMPSVYFEATGRMVVEALAHGIPVLCSKDGGIPEMGKDVVSYVSEPLNPEVWIKHIDYILSHSERYKDRIKRGLLIAENWLNERPLSLMKLLRDLHI